MKNIFRTIVVALSIAFSAVAANAQNEYFLEGLKYFNLKEYTAAKAQFIKALEVDSTGGNDAAFYYLSRIAMIEKSYDNAEKLLQRAIEKDSVNTTYKEALAQIYLAKNNLAMTIEIYDRLVKANPKRMNYYYTLAELYIAAKDLPAATKLIERIEQVSGRNEATASLRFKIFRMEDNWDGAVEYFTDFDSEQQSVNVETLLGDLYLERYKDTLAMEYYEKALSHQRNYIPAIYGKSEVYRVRKDYPNFFKTVKVVMADDAMNPQGKVAYVRDIMQTPGVMTTYQKEMDSLITTLNAANPSDTLVKQLVVGYYLQGERKHEAVEVIRDYTLTNPSPQQVTEYISFLLYVEDYKPLEKLLTGKECDTLVKHLDAISLTDRLDILAFVFFKEERYKESIDIYKRLEKEANAAGDKDMLLKTYSLLGDLSHLVGDVQGSYSYYKKALKINPDEIAVLNNYAYYLSLQKKDLKRAYNMSKKTIEAEPDNPTYLDTFGWILFLMDKPIEAKSTFKHAMLYGGKESAAILDHYAEVLYSLKEYDLAFIYWNQAKAIDTKNEMNLDQKIKERKEALK